MAKRRRRRKQGSNAGGLLAKAFVTLFILMVMIGSFLLFVAWWYFERKGARLIKPVSIHDFDHTNKEIKAISQHERELDRIDTRLDKIEHEGQSLTKRQDGMFNERSKKGKQFNNEINDLSPKADNLEQSLADLEALPEKRSNEWLFSASMPLSFRFSILSYVISFSLFIWLEPTWVLQLSQKLQSLSLLDFYASYPIAYGASVGSLVISLIILGISFFYIKGEKKELLCSTSSQEHHQEYEVDDTSSDDENMTIEDFMKYLVSLSHADLKLLADEFEIKADRRSKATILEAISNEEVDVINGIYSKLFA
ncbi:hypothetical protein D5R81_11990 [Parashewanella spongiae]|uniref:Uncharacterized protein n=1 Tax=Parashewanella spongiae TaxID=342950 RepID=A0A3A6TVH4_9GAMM|nr:hypothetical protein [Parashewanella spongiae]MCL1078624.1 hypothetical protein [Parashewanella spongiae]RJY13026.1 hypothetical protein D5R81_11990 [Parashewanella spongiae]